MISIVICARMPELKPELVENIRQFIGCEHEVVVIDNSENRYSIFEAYNLGIDRSKGDLICFMHDDVLLHTQGWGTIAEKLFADNESMGLLGVAGARVKSRTPSAWWDCPRELQASIVIHHRHRGDILKINHGFEQHQLPEAVAIDGLFMILRKSTGVRMNTQFQGFHVYDLSLSIECRMAGYRVHLTNQILVEHFSQGTINNAWIDATFLLHKLYKHVLPMAATNALDRKKMKKIEFENGVKMIARLKSACYRRIMIVPLWLRLLVLNPFAKIHLTTGKYLLLTALGRILPGFFPQRE